MRRHLRLIAYSSLCGFVAMPFLSHASTDHLSPNLKRAVECMLSILRTTPGITDVTISDDPRWFCLGYSPAEETRWVGLTQFCLQSERGDPSGPYDFTGSFPGIWGARETPDIHVSKGIMDKWNAKCGVRANGVFN